MEMDCGKKHKNFIAPKVILINFASPITNVIVNCPMV